MAVALLVSPSASAGPQVGRLDPAGKLSPSGGMAERPNARLLKSLELQDSGGSNPSPSAAQTVFPR